MTNDITKQWNEISKTAIESMKELGNINTRVIEKLTEQQLAVLSTCMEASQKEIEMTASGKNAQNPQDLLAAQAELLAEYNSRIMNIVHSTGDILKDCNTEITSWADKGMNIAQKPAAKSAPKTVKKTTKKKTRKKATKK
jgi:phasin family protein